MKICHPDIAGDDGVVADRLLILDLQIWLASWKHLYVNSYSYACMNNIDFAYLHANWPEYLPIFILKVIFATKISPDLSSVYLSDLFVTFHPST